MPAANPRCFHGPARRQIGWPETHAVHARARPSNLFDIVDAFRRLQRAAMNRRVAMIELAQDVLNGKKMDL